MPDLRLIRTFLAPQHASFAARFSAFAAAEIAPRAAPAEDALARREARALVALFGKGDWLRPVFELDLRACCLARETLGEVSPLADAVFALQALGTTPLLIAGTAAQRERWLISRSSFSGTT